MTERYKGFVVALSDDIREDDAEAIITAIRMIKGVNAVAPLPATHNDWIIRQRLAAEVEQEIWSLVEKLRKG